nr:hypothetical protein [Tanacetum cinerariifolium]
MSHLMEDMCLLVKKDARLLAKELQTFPRHSPDIPKDLTCLVAKASADECMLWHRRLGHLNFRTMNKLVMHNLVRGLPTKCFENDHTCTACLKGKQHKASCKSKLVNSVSKPLHTLRMDLFGPTSGSLRKKGNEGYFIGYSMSSKAFRVFNKRTRRVEENLHVEFLENKAIEKGAGPNWLFDIDSLTKSMNYVLVDAGINSSNLSGIKREFSHARTPQQNGVAERRNRTLIEAARTMLADARLPVTFWAEAVNTACYVQNRGSLKQKGMKVTLLDTQCLAKHLGCSIREPEGEVRLVSKRVANQEETPSMDNILSLTNRFEDILGVLTSSDEIIRVEADVSNMETSISASPTPTLRIHKDHPKSQIIGPVDTSIRTRHKSKMVEEQKPKRVSDALQDPSWVEAMQEELLQFKIQKVSTLVDCPKGVRPIGTKWVLKNKKDERGIVVRNKARLVAQGHTQEEGINYDEVFAPVARIEAIRLFLAYASFMGFTVYRIDVKSAFLYSTIDEEVYVMQPPGFQDPAYPAKTIVATSTTKAEYVAAASCCRQVLWIQNQLLDYGYCFEKKLISVDHIHTDENVLDLLTKPFDAERFQYLVVSIGMVKHVIGGFFKGILNIYTSFEYFPLLDQIFPTDYHNMVAILEKGEHNSDFHPMVDFLEASPLMYALTVKPTVYISHIRQFWSTARIDTTEEGTKILATVDDIVRTVSESSLRRNLKLRDEDGISSLPDAELFGNLTLMGYNISANQKFTFQKGQFSHQWKYLIHTIMQCLSPKSTGFNEFSSNIATALVCLSTNRTYNFSKMIFDGLVNNINNKGKRLGTPTEPHHTPSPMDQTPSHTTQPTSSLPPVSTTSILTVTPSKTITIRQYTRRARIAQSSSLLPVADEPASPVRDVSQEEACPTDSGFIANQDRATIAKSSTLPHDSAPRGMSMNEGEAATKIISDDTEEMETVLTSIDAATVLAGGIDDVPTCSGSIPTAGPPAADIPTSSDMVPTASPVFAPATVEELQSMIDGLDRNNETISKYLQEYQQFAAELTLERRIKLISDLVKYQENYAKIYMFQSQQRKSWTKKQKREYYMAVIRKNLGWKVKDFKGMTFEEVEAKFNSVYKQMEDFIPMSSKEEAERYKRKGIRFDQESLKKLKSSEEVIEEAMSTDEIPKEKIKEMMQLIPIEEVYVEALQVKHPIIDWKVHLEGHPAAFKFPE